MTLWRPPLYQNITVTSQVQHRNSTTATILEHHQNSPGTWNISRTRPEHHRNITGTSLEHHHNIPAHPWNTITLTVLDHHRTAPQHHWNTAETLPEHPESSLEHHQNTLGTSTEYHHNIPGTSLERHCIDSTETPLENPWNITTTPPEHHRNIIRTSLEYNWNFDINIKTPLDHLNNAGTSPEHMCPKHSRNITGTSPEHRQNIDRQQNITETTTEHWPEHWNTDQNSIGTVSEPIGTSVVKPLSYQKSTNSTDLSDAVSSENFIDDNGVTGR